MHRGRRRRRHHLARAGGRAAPRRPGGGEAGANDARAHGRVRHAEGHGRRPRDGQEAELPRVPQDRARQAQGVCRRARHARRLGDAAQERAGQFRPPAAALQEGPRLIQRGLDAQLWRPPAGRAGREGAARRHPPHLRRARQRDRRAHRQVAHGRQRHCAGHHAQRPGGLLQLQGQEVRGLREVQGALQDGQGSRPQPEGLPLHLRPALPAAGEQAAREEGPQGRLQEWRPADHDGEDLRAGRQELQGLQGRRRQDSRDGRQGGRGRQQQRRAASHSSSAACSHQCSTLPTQS